MLHYQCYPDSQSILWYNNYLQSISLTAFAENYIVLIFSLFLVGRLLKNHSISFPSMWCFVNCIFLFFPAGTVKKFGKNQVIVPQTRVARSISVKDVISVLEREPQMSKSPLIYRLYERNQSDSAGE